MTDDSQTVTAHREFCYRWTCECGCENRQDSIVAGYSNVCRECGATVKVTRIEYENGAELVIG